MQLPKALWALAGAALCCFLVLVIHAQFLKEGNCPRRGPVPGRCPRGTFGRRGRRASPGSLSATAGREPWRGRSRAQPFGAHPRRGGLGALEPPGAPVLAEAAVPVPCPTRPRWQRRSPALRGPSVDGTRAPRWRAPGGRRAGGPSRARARGLSAAHRSPLCLLGRNQRPAGWGKGDVAARVRSPLLSQSMLKQAALGSHSWDLV